MPAYFTFKQQNHSVFTRYMSVNAVGQNLAVSFLFWVDLRRSCDKIKLLVRNRLGCHIPGLIAICVRQSGLCP